MCLVESGEIHSYLDSPEQRDVDTPTPQYLQGAGAINSSTSPEGSWPT